MVGKIVDNCLILDSFVVTRELQVKFVQNVVLHFLRYTFHAYLCAEALVHCFLHMLAK